MVELRVYDTKGKAKGGRTIADADLGASKGTALVKQVVLTHLNNAKKRTAQTKTRSDVAGSGTKPWKQKGTGRARSGCKRSPIWRGGGSVFGPHPRITTRKVSVKMKRVALRTTIAGKAQADEIVLIEDLVMEKPLTKTVSSLFKTIGVLGSRVLLVTDNEVMYRSARNIPKVSVKGVSLVNAHDMLNSRYVVMNQADFDALLMRAKS